MKFFTMMFFLITFAFSGNVLASANGNDLQVEWRRIYNQQYEIDNRLSNIYDISPDDCNAVSKLGRHLMSDLYTKGGSSLLKTFYSLENYNHSHSKESMLVDFNKLFIIDIINNSDNFKVNNKEQILKNVNFYANQARSICSSKIKSF